MKKEELKSKAAKIGKKLAMIALGVVLAQGVLMATTEEAQADGTCFKSSNICGLNGHNYSNHTFQE